ncbi:FtsH protease activity modulator HflK [Pseudochrobactrum kiredjianiae]|uniref:Protein HflK n=1 Tax=Pseudochrobactrum kiredjianiae TaxID=386305 RepID=A0ABW3V3Y1_9HYPH|nr:FtsH protease activity modulator HflK [Pseudochrobactrum kiredjianiae]MDM7851132.1 FtsH protease activity modulator HflK [Pseudochrobactrum kiredjianiae]
MPWSNQNGGGPWGGGDKNGGSGNGGSNNGGSNQGGPWGQGPKGPRGGPGGSGGTPPDLEDILRKGQDRLKKVIPGGGGNGGGPALYIIGAIALVGFWLFQAMYTVQPDELAVEMRFGVPKEVVSVPGLHFHLWPIETYEKATTGERQINIGGQGTRGATQGLMLTGDQNIVNVQFSVLYRVSDPRAYLFNVQDPDNMVRQISESAIRETVGRRPAQDIFRDNRAAIAQSVRDIVQETLNGYGAGIQITALSIEDAAPPREVADAFDEVQRAEQDEDRFVEESNQYSNQKLGQARGQAAQVREEAAAYKTRMVQEAEGESQRFNSVLGIYKQSPDVTRDRLFIETMEQVLKDSNKVIIEGGNNVMPYLPLTELMRQQGKPAATATGGSQ